MNVVAEIKKWPWTFKVTNTDEPSGKVLNDYLGNLGVKPFLNLIAGIGPVGITVSLELRDPDFVAALLAHPDFQEGLRYAMVADSKVAKLVKETLDAC